MKTNLFVCYYTTPSQERQDELRHCIHSNINNVYLDYIYVITFEYDEFIKTIQDIDKVRIIFINDDIILSYGDFLNFAKTYIQSDSFCIFTNTDIIFDETIKNCDMFVNDYDLACISRLELCNDGNWKYINNPHQSHDAWIINGLSLLKYIDQNLLNELSHIKLGTPRCEMKMAALFYTYGWTLKNICNFVNIKHIHKSSLSRTYSVFNTLNIGLNAEVYPVYDNHSPSKINLICSTVRDDLDRPNISYTNWIGSNIDALNKLDQMKTYKLVTDIKIKNNNSFILNVNNIYCIEVKSNSYFHLLVRETGQKIVICPGRNIQYINAFTKLVNLTVLTDSDDDNCALLVSHFHREPQI